MENKQPKVLVISSVDPSIGPAIVALEHYNALKKAGLEVDFLTKYPVEGHPEFISVLNKKIQTPRLWIRIKEKVKHILHVPKCPKQLPGYYFFYEKETEPPVSVDLVLEKVQKPYDVVYIVFWQELLSFATIDALFDKLHCQFQFQSADYSPMSGGCHFTGNCLRYQTGCGRCPAICSNDENDFTKWNVEYRKQVYKKVHPIVYGNTYMNFFFKKSYLLGEYDRLETVLPLVNADKYSPQNIISVREKYSIPSEKEFIMFMGSQSLSDERKGISYLLQALKYLYEDLTIEDRAKILLVLAGRDIEPIKTYLCFDYLYLGYVKSEELPGIYSMANVFLSPSVNDAGPTMVNQAMSCGTPIVAFEMGTALDVVKEQGTGYCAKLRDAKDFANGIKSIYQLSPIQFEALKSRCRDVSLNLTSTDSFVRNFFRIYNKYNN
ncbi:MAG: glycosyltransferase [Salinivirgaceae bacterium]|nr:glycosyltransferase [Salinivirgaceae bacterium]